MIFIDSNILIALLNEGVAGDEWLKTVMARAIRDEQLVCNLVVVAEVAAGFDEADRLLPHLKELTIEIIDLTAEAAFRAAKAHREYRRRGGQRSTMLPDFLIGAHAVALGASLMTRNRRLASYFPDLTFLTPENEYG